MIKVVLHGGLGNQLFQVFVAELEAQKWRINKLVLFSDRLSAYAAVRDFELAPVLNKKRLGFVVRDSDFLAKLRLPKFAMKIMKHERVWTIFKYGILIDGYFQSVNSYTNYPKNDMRRVISDWTYEVKFLDIIKPKDRNKIYHIRLGDFFKDEVEAVVAARKYVQLIDEDLDIISDQEDLLRNVLLDANLPFTVNIIDTTKMGAWDLISLFSRYRFIITNGSTLAFWAGVLAASNFKSSNESHNSLFRILSR